MSKPTGERRALMTQTLAVAAAALCGGSAEAAMPVVVAPVPAEPFKAVFQVSDAEPQKWNLTLNNARNALAELGPGTIIEVVAFGPGIAMFRTNSEVTARLAEAVAQGIKMVVCQNSMRGQHLEPKDMNPLASIVPSGASEIIRRQADGYAYLRS